MTSDKTDTPRASNDDVRNYITAMVEELAQMAAAIGEAEWAEAMREAIGSSVRRPQNAATPRQF